MPQLDRILPRLDGGAASHVILEADAPIRCASPTGLQSLTQQTFSREQVLALVAEVALPEERASVADAKAIKLTYAWNGQRYLVSQETESPILKLVIR